MLELMEPECESKLVALALQHLAQGWVATEENCDLGEKMTSKFNTFHILADKKVLAFLCFLIFTIFSVSCNNCCEQDPTLPIFCSRIFANTWQKAP